MKTAHVSVLIFLLALTLVFSSGCSQANLSAEENSPNNSCDSAPSHVKDQETEKQQSSEKDAKVEKKHIPYKEKLAGFQDRMNQPVPIDENGQIIVNDGYHDEVMVQQLLEAFAERYADIASLHSIGKTWQDRDLLVLKISDNPDQEEDEPAFFFVGAHHGSELLSTEFVLDTIEYILKNYQTDEHVQRWVSNYEIWCMPLANPDGLHRFFHVTGTGRKNGRDNNNNGIIDSTDGVDLNRNYPFRWHTLGETASKSDPNHAWYRGPQAASEPEVKAIMDFAEKQRFVMMLSYHTAATKILVPYTIDDVQNPDPSAAWVVGREMAKRSQSARDDKDYVAVRNLYSVDGTDQDWHYWKYGTLSYIWEGPRNNPSFEEHRDPMVHGVRGGWQYMLNRLADGPTLSGHTIDATTGKPLEAIITLDEIKTFENEVHTTHPDTGRFDLVLPQTGTYHLRGTKEGYQDQIVEVTVGQEWKLIDVPMIASEE